MVTLAGGKAFAFMFNPAMNYGTTQPSGYAPTNSWSGNWSKISNSAQLFVTAEKYRPVSAGIKIVYTGSALLATGQKWVSLKSAGGDPDTWNDVISKPGEYPLASITRSDQTVFITWRPSDVSNFIYQEVDNQTITGTASNSGYPYICVSADGLATDANFVFDIVINYEVIPKSGTISLLKPEASGVDLKAFADANTVLQSPDLDYARSANNMSEYVKYTLNALPIMAAAYVSARHFGTSPARPRGMMTSVMSNIG
jgi:hypothetical protein